METRIKLALTFCFVFLVEENLFSQSVVVSPLKANFLIEWIQNPMQILIENEACEDLIVKVDKGKITKDKCNYTYQTDGFGFEKVKFTVGINTGKKVKWMDSIFVAIKKLPDPFVHFAAVSGKGSDTVVSKSQIMAFPNICVMKDGVGLEILKANPQQSRIKSFTLVINRNDSSIFQEKYNSIKYSDSIWCVSLSKMAKTFIYSNCKTGDRVIIEDIVILLYEKEERLISRMDLRYYNQ